MNRKILVTCALPYANGEIHLGHLLEHIEADIWVRFQRMRGHECVFFCADDTHGTPVMITARSLGVSPEELIVQKQKEHLDDLKMFEISYDHYSSTNCEENRILCEEFFAAMQKNKQIEVRSIDQLFSEKDNMFLPDRFIKGTCPKCKTAEQYGDSCENCGSTYSPTDLIDARSAMSGEKLVLKKSDHIFFKLNNFRDFLANWVPDHTGEEVSNKMAEWFSEALRDWDISRDEPYFGFQIPGFKGKYFYVWVDAPIGYIATTWQWCKEKGYELKDYWQNDRTEIYHFIGKDIVYFHTLFWPAMLENARYTLPKRVQVHGFVTVDGEKMSKSRGTFITAKNYAQHLDINYLRYYYACKLNGKVDDLDLNFDDFIQRVNSDLVGKIVNLGSRSAQMLTKKFAGKLSVLDDKGTELLAKIQAAGSRLAELYEERKLSHVVADIRALADESNRYFDELEPWKLIKSDPELAQRILTSTLNAFRILIVYLSPIVPSIGKAVAELFAERDFQWQDTTQLRTNQNLHEFKHLLKRVEPEKVILLKSASK